MNEVVGWLSDGEFTRFLVNVAWQSTLIGIGAVLVIRTLKRRPAARSLVAVLACFLCVAAPLLTAVVRSQGLGLLTEQNETSVPEVNQFASPGDGFSADLERNMPEPDAASTVVEIAAVSTNLPVEAAADVEVVATESTAAELRVQPEASASSFTLNPRLLLIAAWVAAVIFFGIRLLLSALAILRMWRKSQACDDSVLQRSCRRAADLLNLPHVPPVFICKEATCPAVISWFRVRLIVPTIDSQRSEQHWVSVFAHELAHVTRRDGWSQLITELAVVLLPWQPLIWILRREFATASEEACDDWAVFSGAEPVDYAATLTDWIRHQVAIQTL